ncbi:ABC-type amino acid transport system, permease component [Lacticaseibacillus sharpeae JCM 1186 = DSM 20505]|uniref:ABC-type amino acid transport system, permease component n=2 Tax=Lacticaseibacillus sharpeae TaxID=1626 RepID=A0A0R1ZLB8_9LACO|nr:ABC-type amino acid transport system, permease component [Lacticaseibacillus sharpeae JCM 1186 = DSM 20505]
MQRLLGGFLVTLRVAVIVLIVGGILGVLLGALRTLHNRPLQVILRVYLEIFRIIPTVVLLFVAYYILPQTFGLNLPGEAVAILVFTLWTAAEMSDIVRGALESVPVHQKESGEAIGLTQTQLFRYVLIPQAIPVVLPGTINLATRIIKTTSLLLMISVMDIVNVGQTLVEANGHKNPSAAFWIYGAMFVLYYILCAPLSQWAKRVEKKRLERANG